MRLACQGAAARAERRDRHRNDTALKIGAACGYDLGVLSEVLPAAEASLVEALSTKGDQLAQVSRSD